MPRDSREGTMAGNPRENGRDRGFWDGGPRAHGTAKESGGRTSGMPGVRKPGRYGIRIDLERPGTVRLPEEGETDQGGVLPHDEK
jgi:hypothetical protein